MYDVVTRANFAKQEGNGKTAYYEWLGSNNPLTASYQIELIVVVGSNGDVITSHPVTKIMWIIRYKAQKKANSHGGSTSRPMILNPTS